MVPFGEYCAFTKSLEYLGDRWSLLIVRNLAILGPQGFNAIADGLPGISRSVLARRLRTLEELGLLARTPSRLARQAPYGLTPAGEQLMPTLMSLRGWAEHWVPEDPAIAQRDPDIIVWWLTQRFDPGLLPELQVVLALTVEGTRRKSVWLLLEPNVAPSVCLEDPKLSLERYVYVEADADRLLPIARGRRDWATAIAAGDIHVFGEPELIRKLPGWFRPADLQGAAV